jgi:hypothetical protein
VIGRHPDPVWVYFLRPVGGEGPIKIGMTRSPQKRLIDYMRWSPVPLELVAKIQASQKMERQFHALFLHLHSHHEWFHAGPDLTAAMDAINAGSFDLATLPKTGCLLGARGEAAWDGERRARASIAAKEGWARRRAWEAKQAERPAA